MDTFNMINQIINMNVGEFTIKGNDISKSKTPSWTYFEYGRMVTYKKYKCQNYMFFNTLENGDLILQILRLL